MVSGGRPERGEGRVELLAGRDVRRDVGEGAFCWGGGGDEGEADGEVVGGRGGCGGGSR